MWHIGMKYTPRQLLKVSFMKSVVQNRFHKTTIKSFINRVNFSCHDNVTVM